MSLLSELKTILGQLKIPVETGIFKNAPPDRYAVLTPLSDLFMVYSDNKPEETVEEVRIGLFDKGNYLTLKKKLEAKLIANNITITDRRYITHEDTTGYHQYAIDVANYYYIEEE